MDDVVAIYGEEYFENPAFRETNHEAYFGYMDYLRDRGNIQLRLGQVLDQIERHEWKGRLLDVGCGMGMFVEVASQSGWDAWGVDLNEHAVKWAQENVSPNVLHGLVGDLGFEEGSFDCVTMFDVIEHLDDPRRQLPDVWRLLRPGGLLVVITPDAGALVSRALGSRWLEMKRAPEHLHFFDVEGLAQMLALSGFTAFEWHSVGKISTVRTMLADLRFYSDSLFAGVEDVLDRWGWADRVIDVDPRTKLCMYARKTSEPVTEFEGLPDVTVRRVRTRGLGRPGVRTVKEIEETTDLPAPVAAEEFAANQRHYWERKERFLDPRLPGPTAFTVPKLDWAAEHLDLAHASVLDVGAGNGTVTWHLAQRARSVVGLDLSQNLLDRRPDGLDMVKAAADRLPFPDQSFDVVVESNFLHHVADPVAILREMRRVCRKRLLLIEPNRWHVPMSMFMAVNPSERRGLAFDMTYVTRLTAAAGLRVIAAAPQGAVYPNVTPSWLLPALRRFDRPGPRGAYVVAVCEPTGDSLGGSQPD
jgi:2-polyprenyl-3-methyl-5-hydroxy-6-metoxy-1,4-benzoquinol methylase